MTQAALNLYWEMSSKLDIVREDKYDSIKDYLNYLYTLLRKSIKSLAQEDREKIIQEIIDFNKIHQEWKDQVLTWDNLEKSMLDMTSSLQKCYGFFVKGDYVASINTMKNLLKRQNKFLASVVFDEDCSFYRIRMRDDHQMQPFSRPEMFHVPFNRRYLIKSYRFSALGTPCLYLGSSLLSCWAEMNEPDIKMINMAGLKTHNKVTLLDLSFPPKDIVKDAIPAFVRLVTLPLYLATSIKVKHQGQPFVPEYVIPQVLMMALLTDPNHEIDGCWYTSTKKDNNFNYEDSLWNQAAIPVKDIKTGQFYCNELANQFLVSESRFYEHELIRNTLHFGNGIPGQYRFSTFGQIEDLFKEYQSIDINKEK